MGSSVSMTSEDHDRARRAVEAGEVLPLRRRPLMRILIVEDEPSLQAQWAKGLGAAGYALDAAGNGVDAHYLGATEPYDAVILDLGLPQMDGASPS